MLRLILRNSYSICAITFVYVINFWLSEMRRGRERSKEGEHPLEEMPYIEPALGSISLYRTRSQHTQHTLSEVTWAGFRGECMRK